ncbi:hypothetical protein Aduo_017682 [Ancylostoma duodenale]
MLIPLLFLANLWVSHQSEDFENAKILGFPRLVCSKKSLTFDFDTNIPFQGRISVMKKIHRQACVQDYSENIQRNATFKVELQHCMELTYMNNGSRVFSAQIEVGFHPLVITNSDRLFSVRCIDNSHAVAHLTAKKEDNSCTHTVRLASRWESGTVFHVGDAVVHEWNCNFSIKEGQKYQTFLTNCNALSNAGQVIHLVDENGCIVDSELMGEIVYNNFMPKIFARARVFKLVNDEKYRIECQVQMCTMDGVCKDRIFPPKCAFTKEEILNRYMAKPRVDSIEDTIMTGTINNRYERQVKVASEWITVHNNQYTNIEQLHERYYLSTIMNDKMEDTKAQPVMRHFLMGISYRNPNQTDTFKNESAEKDTSSESSINPSVAFRPNNTPSISAEIFDVEMVSPSGSSLPIPAGTAATAKTAESSSKNSTIDSKRQQNASNTKGKSKQPPAGTMSTSTASNKTRSKTETTRLRQTTQKPKTTTSRTSTTQRTSTTTKSLNQGWRGSRTSTAKPFPKEDIVESTTKDAQRGRDTPATLHFYPNTNITPVPSTTPMRPHKTIGNHNHLHTNDVLSNKISRPSAGVNKAVEVTADPESSVFAAGDNDISTTTKEKFANPRDWRLDDRTINDTDILPERQVACSNATIIASQRKCTWSGIEHLLVVWSFASLLVWMVMIAVCFYRQANKPAWVEFR